MTLVPTCSALSRQLHEPHVATASTVRRWLLVESPGAWGPESIPQASLGPHAAPLVAAAKAAGARLLLLRSPGRLDPARRTCLLGRSGPGTPTLRRLAVDDLGELLDLDLPAAYEAAGDGPGQPVDGPVHLVCTHGRHDPCCAELGRPLVRVLSPRFPEVWECTHVGGDRFAGNLLAFPHGLYFGRLGPDDGLRVAAAYAAGEIELDHFRGRSCFDWVTQAADFFLRTELGLRGVDDVRPDRRTSLGGGEHAVDAALADGSRVRVRVGVATPPPARTTSCKAPGAITPPAYRLLSIDRA